MVDAAPPVPKPVRELGYATSGSVQFWSDLTGEETPELRWPLAPWVFDRMRRQDAQVGSSLRAVTSPILRTQTRVDGSGCRDEVVEFVASNLGLPIVGAADDPDEDETHTANLRGRDRFSWNEHKRLALLMLPFGHSYFEQVYRWDEDTDKFRLRKLAPRLSKSIAQVNVARDGGLVSIQQWDNGAGSANIAGGGFSGGLGKPINVNRLVAYVLEREGGNWLGQSLLRTAYKNWLLKDRALRTWSQLIDRQGMGIPDYEGAPNETSLDAGLDIATSVRAGDNSGVARPNGSKLQLLGVTGTLPDVDAFVRYQDEQIARSVLAHVLNLATQKDGQVGSYNMASVLKDTLHLSLEVIDGQFHDTANAHVVEDLVDINFGSTEPAPRLVSDPLGTTQTELDRVREDAGLTSDADLVRWLRTVPNTQEAA
ncbi:DUF935 domain-containing protein [Nocardioides sp. SR21]|uniref:DUF935 domain-containing protein n=1 Tax=Nocardioides sp. SR21 TaxID=2919501 RepID=UPI001FAAD2F5|nr:DUF935 domain-containing protein [Nocardioides sp. SR21]